LRYGGELISHVATISIWGERLADDDLEIWVSWEGTDHLKEEIRRFAERHGLNIIATEVPKTASKLLAVLRGGGKLPDVAMVQSDAVSGLARAKALQNLDYLSIPNMTPKGWEAFQWEDKIWAVPFTFDVQLIFYNPDIAELNHPNHVMGGKGTGWTLSELESIAERIRQQGSSDSAKIVPMAWNVYSAYWVTAFQKGFGKADIIEPDGGIRIDDEPTKEALRYLLDLSRKGLLQPMERDAMIATFASGRAGIILSGSYSIPHFIDLGIPFGVMAYPVHPTHGAPLAPFLDFKGFALTRKTRHPVLARRLIQHLTGAGVQQRFSLSLTKMPARRDVWPAIEEKNPYFPALSESYEKGIVVPTAPSYAIFKNTMWKLLRLIFSAQMSIDEALEQGQRIINTQLAAIAEEER
jgi:ABC-type glycerol-3-phosphate transport system substrate-binding protein